MLSRGVGGGELELQPPAAPSEASTGRHKLCQNAGDSFPLSKGIIIPPSGSRVMCCRSSRSTARLPFVGMVAVVTRVQRFDVKLLCTRSRATDGSTIARGLRGAISRGGKGVKDLRLKVKRSPSGLSLYTFTYSPLVLFE